LYGAAIWLIAQIFHISANFPLGVLVWALGVLPLPFANKHVSFSLLFVLILTIWTIVSMAESDPPQAEFFYPLILCATMIPFVYLRRQKSLLIAIIYGLIIWLIIANRFYHNFDFPIFPVLISIFFLCAILYLIGFIHSISPNLPKFFRRLATFSDFDSSYQRIILLLLPLFLLSFKDIISEEISNYYYYYRREFPIIALILGIIAVITLVKSYILLHFSSKRPKLASYELGFFTFTLSLFLAFLLTIPYFNAIVQSERKYWRELVEEALPYLILFNIALFGGSLFFIIVGVLKQRKSVLAAGSLSLIAAILARYFDQFFEFLDRALFFTIGGVILLVTAFLIERGTRKLAKTVGGIRNE
ncbi:MAG: DUF2157 domain-containing protein, partial [Planctomycetota bacterium]|nr:DUF2157 domain-containing protein [Planctomycetota bacterium]